MKSTIFLILITLYSTAFCSDHDRRPSRFRTSEKTKSNDTTVAIPRTAGPIPPAPKEPSIEKLFNHQSELGCSSSRLTPFTPEQKKVITLLRLFHDGYQPGSTTFTLYPDRTNLTLSEHHFYYTEALKLPSDHPHKELFLQNSQNKKGIQISFKRLRITTDYSGSRLLDHFLKIYTHAANTGEFDEFASERSALTEEKINMYKKIGEDRALGLNIFDLYDIDAVEAFIRYNEMCSTEPAPLSPSERHGCQLIIALLSKKPEERVRLGQEFIQSDFQILDK